MQYCTASANAFRCLPASSNKLGRVFHFSGQQRIRLVHLFMNCDTVAFHHCVPGKSWVWLFLLGPAPFAFCFVSLLDGEAHIWLGDLRFALCGFLCY